MGKKDVAILDIRSRTVSAAIGTAGVNNTFLFRARETAEYEGYDQDRFYAEDELEKAISSVLHAVEVCANENVRSVYVGVPGAFLQVRNVRRTISFPSAKRIRSADIETLYQDGYEPAGEEPYRVIHAAALYFLTSDGRKVSDPCGIVSVNLEAEVSYTLASNYFIGTLEKVLKNYGVRKIRFVPSPYAQTHYLFSADKRNGGAILLDVGELSSTVCAVYGNGIRLQKSFWAGEGHLAAYLYSELGITYEEACSLVKNYNLYRGGALAQQTRVSADRSVPTEQATEIVKMGLDGICEPLSAFLEELLSFRTQPVFLTGEGITGIRGITEFMSGRIEREVRLIAPELPYYNKPKESALIALLNFAVREEAKEGFFYKIFKR